MPLRLSRVMSWASAKAMAAPQWGQSGWAPLLSAEGGAQALVWGRSHSAVGAAQLCVDVTSAEPGWLPACCRCHACTCLCMGSRPLLSASPRWRFQKVQLPDRVWV